MRADPTHDLPGQIIGVLEALEEATDTYADSLARASNAESKYRLAHAEATIRLADGALPGKMTVATREAHALLQARDEYSIWMIHQAAADSARQYLYTLRAKLDALRTLNANIRALTDPRLPT